MRQYFKQLMAVVGVLTLSLSAVPVALAAPSITGIQGYSAGGYNNSAAVPGGYVILYGTFGESGNELISSGSVGGDISYQSSSQINIQLGSGTGTASFAIRHAGVESNSMSIEVVGTPSITGIQGYSSSGYNNENAVSGGYVVLYGSFASNNNELISSGSVGGDISYQSATQINVRLGSGTGTASFAVRNGGGTSNSMSITVVSSTPSQSTPTITGIQGYSSSGYNNSQAVPGGFVVLYGSFAPSGNELVSSGSVSGSITYQSATQINVQLGNSTGTATFAVRNSGGTSNSMSIAVANAQTAAAPSITGIQGYSSAGYNNTQAISGNFVVLYGTFAASGNELVSSGSVSGSITYQSASQINVQLASGTGTATFAVRNSNGTSNSMSIPVVSSTSTTTTTPPPTTGQNTLAISNDTTLVAGPIPPGTINLIFSAFKLTAGATPVTITALQIVSDSAASNQFTNIFLTKNGNQYISTNAASLGTTSGSTRYTTFTLTSPLAIAANSTAILEVTASLTDAATGSVRLGIQGLQFSGTAPTVTPALPLYGPSRTITTDTTTTGTASLAVTSTPLACTATANAAQVTITVAGTSGTSYIVKRNGNNYVTFIGSGSATDSVAIGGTNSYTLTANGTQIGTAKTVTGARATGCTPAPTTGTLSITSPEQLPEGVVGQKYTYTLAASGGTAPYSWALQTGQFNTYPCCFVELKPNGTFTAPDNVTSFMPFAGTYQLPVKVTDANGTSVQKTLQYSIKASGTQPTPTGTKIAEGYIDALSATAITGWAYTNQPLSGQVPGIVVVFENTANTNQTYSLSLQPTQVRTDVSAYLQNKYGLSTVSAATGFSGNPSSVITTNGTYRIKSSTYDGTAFVLSEAAKKSFTIGAGSSGNAPTGKYVKVEGDPTVYWVTSWGGKMPILTAAVFTSYGSRWEDVVVVSQEVLDDYPDVEYIKLQGNARVYKIEGGVKRYLTQAAATRLNVDPAKVVTVNSTEFYSYRTGQTIQ